MRRLLLLFALFSFAACSGGHPLEGSWNEQLADGKPGMSIQFSMKSDECYVHGRPEADGHHDHVNGTYTFDEAAGKVMVNAKLLGDKGPAEWSGTLVDGKLSLGSADQKLEFALGKAAH